MYGEFYPTGYYGATPQMQDRLAMLEQQRQMQRPPQPMTVHGHLVTGIEEARAAQVMLDGTPSYFPSPAEGKIYEKSIDLNGMPVFKVYVVSKEPPKQEATPAGALAALQAKVEEMEKTLNSMKEEKDHESVPVNRHAAAGTKSRRNDPADGGN